MLKWNPSFQEAMGHMLLSTLFQGAILGFSAAAAPGPFQAYLLARSVQYGWIRAIPVALAPIPSDAFIITTVLLILSRITMSLLNGIEIAGGMFIIVIGLRGLVSAKPKHEVGEQGRSESGGRSLVEATLLNALNPHPWLFWASVGGPLFITAWHKNPIIGVAFLCGFHGTFVALMVVLAVFCEKALSKSDAMVQILSLSSAGVLIAFGVFQIWSGIRRL